MRWAHDKETIERNEKQTSPLFSDWEGGNVLELARGEIGAPAGFALRQSGHHRTHRHASVKKKMDVARKPSV
jgi:hypothetical protein